MVFNFVTVDLSGDSVDFAALFPPESPSTTSCDNDCTCTCTRTIVTRVLASVSRVLTTVAINTDRARPCEHLDVSAAISKSNLRSFTLKELQVATYNFSDRFIVGTGGYGKVYKGLISDGSLVAIKRLSRSSCQGLEEFKAEIETHCRIRHRNLLPAFGLCVSKEPQENILVYPFKVNKDLGSRLRKFQSQPSLDWPTRKRILLEAARGLSYLHNNRIIHCDIKPSNILLDENLDGCITDFGLAKALDKKEQVSSSEVQDHTTFRLATERETATDCSTYEYTKTSRIKGTYGYMAPEYAMRGICSLKIDVFSFGVTILEVVMGRKALFAKNGRGISWIKSCLKENKMDELIDPDMLNNCNEDDVKKIIQLCLACTLVNPEKRPSMFQVVQVLEGACLKDIRNTNYTMIIEREQEEEQMMFGQEQQAEHIMMTAGEGETDSISNIPPEELSGPR